MEKRTTGSIGALVVVAVLALVAAPAPATAGPAGSRPALRAPAPRCTISTVQRLGSRSEAVACVQRALAARGFSPGPADGVFGRMTAAAVVRYQRSQRLVADGVVGPVTGSRLGIWVTAAAPGAQAIIAGTNAYPVPRGYRSSYAIDQHSTYPAADIMAACGTPVVSPVTGRVLEVDRVHTDFSWANTANGWARGGQSVTILRDGVRYYLSHFSSIRPDLRAGSWVVAGQPIARVGTTGMSSACHVHFGLSPPCPAADWWVRRGVVWPAAYLTSWRNGIAKSPAPAVRAWAAANPRACTTPPRR
jgi:peptidoglycan LD-endopeptidase LytH